MGATGSRNYECCSATEERIELLPKNGFNPQEPEITDDNAKHAVIQFSTAQFFCTEEESEAYVDIVRFGDSSGWASVEFSTKDASAKAGHKYQEKRGKVVFAPSETIKAINIQLLSDDGWNATLEFAVHLGKVKGATLGKYMDKCRVKLIDRDCFPTNKFEREIAADQIEHIPGFGLMVEYLKLMLKDSRIRAATVVTVLLDQLTGLYFFLTIYLQMYLVDVVLAADEPEGEGGGSEGLLEDGEGEGEMPSRSERRLLLSAIHGGARMLGRMLGEEEGGGEAEEGFRLMPEVLLIPHHRRRTAIVIGILYMVPFVLLHLKDQYKCFLALPGEPRKSLQANLMRKFLNYKENVRRDVKPSEITMAMVRDVVEVVDCGFMKILNVLQVTGKLLCALVFILAENTMGAIPLVVYPIVLGIWLRSRERKTIEINERKAKEQDEMMEIVDDAVGNFQMISNFSMRLSVMDYYEKCIDEFIEQEQIVRSVVTNNLYVAPWLTTLFIGGYMALGSSLVTSVGGTVTLGAFLATINVFKEVGLEIEEIYRECMEIQLSFGPLQKIVGFMNLDTDLLQRKAILQMRRTQGEIARREARERLQAEQKLKGESTGMPLFAVDHLRILVRDLTFKYEPNPRHPRHHDELSTTLLNNVNVSFEQGKLYAFVGPPREGKATLLKLIGQSILPEEGYGEIFMPPHLRVLHVTQDAGILCKPFLQNLIMSTSLDSAGGMDRIKRICRLVGFSEQVISMLDVVPRPDDLTGWASAFSQTDFARLNLARVFIINPEVLVLHKPVVDFDDDDRARALQLLRRHVDDRGIELSSDEPLTTRRPRTVFFTTATVAGIKAADRVYRVSLKGGVETVRHEDLGNYTRLNVS